MLPSNVRLAFPLALDSSHAQTTLVVTHLPVGGEGWWFGPSVYANPLGDPMSYEDTVLTTLNGTEGRIRRCLNI